MKPTLNLSRRERQLMEALYRLEKASVAEIRGAISDPPSYSAVRAMLTELVRKKQITYRRDGKRYLYRPTKPRGTVGKSALKSVVENFFRGRSSDAICALLDQKREQLTAEEIKRIKARIEQVEAESGNE